PKTEKLWRIYLSFIDHAFNEESGKFRNFMSYNREWLETEGSEDSQGRTIWTLCAIAADENCRVFHPFLEKLIKEALAIPLHSPNALAFSLLGLSCFAPGTYYCGISIDEAIDKRMLQLSAFFDFKNPEWLWSHPEVTYDSCRIPQAFLASGEFLKDSAVIIKGKKLLDWLISHHFEEEIFVPIGNRKWMNLAGKSKFDQQPLEASAMIDACLVAGKNQDEHYFKYADLAFEWFLGRNSIGKTLYDEKTGGCRDGLHPQGVNANQGAESTLASLASALTIMIHKNSHKEESKQLIHENL